jgi:hypothetical protein
MKINEGKELEGLEHAHALTDLSTDVIMNAIDKVKENRKA